MEKLKLFLKRKDIVISAKRYGIDALGAMAQGLFCSLLIGTIINTIGKQFQIAFLTSSVATIAGVDYTVGSLASAMSGPAMAVAIGYLPYHRRFCIKCTGRCRRPSCGTICSYHSL